VAFGKHGDERLAEDRHHDKVPLPGGKPDKADVEPTRAQLLELLSWREDLKDKFNVRVTLAEHRQHSREHTQLCRRHVADDESADLSTARFHRDHSHTVGLHERASCLIEECVAGVRQLDATIGAVEEANTEFALEPADLLAKWWLSDVKLCGGPAEV
jgi:hypothetical protein